MEDKVIDSVCHLQGEFFSPSALLKRLPQIKIRSINERGETGKTGRYKNVPVPYGSCTICTPDGIDVEKRIEWMADYIASCLEVFKETGATEIQPWIYWTGIQGNMEFSSIELKKLSGLGLGLCVDYMFDEGSGE